MDQTFINLALAAGCGALGWFARTLYEAQQELKKDIAQLHVKVTENYVPNTRFESVLNQINANIQRVLDKLDDKADKS